MAGLEAAAGFFKKNRKARHIFFEKGVLQKRGKGFSFRYNYPLALYIIVS